MARKHKQVYRELLTYSIVGISTTLINLIAYWCLLLSQWNYQTANLIALVISKFYGYWANKNWVFHSHCSSIKELLREMMRFVIARGTTGVIDYFGLIMLVETFSANKITAKYIIQVVVIALNFLFGKCFIFIREKSTQRGGTYMQEQDVCYNPGNYKKYLSNNPLKRKMVTNFQKKLMLILNRTISGDCKIIDVGCGEGFTVDLIHKNFPNVSISGCDGASEAVEIARERIPDIHFEVGNIYSLPYGNKEFDIAICTEVLEHLEYPDQALFELRRIARKILITVPHEPWFRIGNMLALHNLKRLGDPVDHIQHWTYNGFRAFIKSKLPGLQIYFDKSFPWSIAVGIDASEE